MRGIINNRLIVILLMTWSLGPLLWQVYTSFATTNALVGIELEETMRWTLDNYRQVLESDPPFHLYIINSTIVGIFSTLITIILALAKFIAELVIAYVWEL